jgi:hypothetical protein
MKKMEDFRKNEGIYGEGLGIRDKKEQRSSADIPSKLG